MFTTADQQRYVMLDMQNNSEQMPMVCSSLRYCTKPHVVRSPFFRVCHLKSVYNEFGCYRKRGNKAGSFAGWLLRVGFVCLQMCLPWCGGSTKVPKPVT